MRQALAAALWLAAGMAAAQEGPIGPERAGALPRADVYVVGEAHDNPTHHEGQAAVIAAVDPTAVVFEMLSPAQAAAWAPAMASDMAALDAGLGWREAGWPDPVIYAPVFKALGEAAVVGAAPDPAAVRRAVRGRATHVFDAADGGMAARYGLDRDLPEAEQAAREAEQQASHCGALPEGLLGGFVEAQRLRDAAFARAVVDAVEAHGPPVVLITGLGHARTDWGVPAVLGLAAPDLSVVSIGQLEGAAGPDAPPFDVVAVTDGPPGGRADPCEGFVPPTE